MKNNITILGLLGILTIAAAVAYAEGDGAGNHENGGNNYNGGNYNGGSYSPPPCNSPLPPPYQGGSDYYSVWSSYSEAAAHCYNPDSVVQVWHHDTHTTQYRCQAYSGEHQGGGDNH